MNILILPPIGWDYPMRQRPQHLASAFGELGRDVVYVDVNPGARSREVAENVRVFAPTPGAKWRRTIKAVADPAAIVAKGIRSAYDTAPDPQIVTMIAGLPDPLVAVIQSPAFAPLVPCLKEKGARIVYDRLDDWPRFPNAPDRWAELDAALLLDADLVWGTCAPLLKGIKGAVLIPNGFDPERFSQPVHGEPSDLLGRHPRVLYAGTLAEWFDFDLVYEAARQLPRFSWVLIGRFHNPTHKLNEPVPANIHFLGHRPYESLSAYYHACDVGIIPFRDIPLCKSVDPVKVYEYLASGLPVVATHLPAVAKFPRVRLVHDTKDFVEAVQASISAPHLDKIVSEFLQDKSWKDRALAALSTL